MYTVKMVLIVLALLFTVLSAIGRGPLWGAVLCLVLERILAVAR